MYDLIFTFTELEILEEILEESLNQDIMTEDTQTLLDKVQGYLVNHKKRNEPVFCKNTGSLSIC